LKTLISLLFAGLLSPFCANALVGHWVFNEPLDVARSSDPGIFHHLESAGRRNIAVTAQEVAVVWEDDRDGTPRIYLAFKKSKARGFSTEVLVSGKGEAYEPSIVALSGNRFALAWEEDGRVHARVVTSSNLGPAIRLGKQESGQASLVMHGGRIVVTYSEQSGRHRRIRLSLLNPGTQLKPQIVISCTVDPEPHKDAQLYPTAVSAGGRLLVAWEDRRPGHSIIMATQDKVGNVCVFDKPARISEAPRGPKRAYGKGHGVARVALAAYGKANIFAVWADKRDYREGYDIYGADKKGVGAFGSNVRVQDDFGELARQWHAAIAGHPRGRLIVAWSDEREGHTDIVISWREAGYWSEDFPVPGASGPGEQTHPSIALDTAGNLHIVWVERKSVGGSTNLRYVFGDAVEPAGGH